MSHTREEIKEKREELGKRWETLFPKERLLCIQLDGFSHRVFFDYLKNDESVKPQTTYSQEFSNYTDFVDEEDVLDNSKVKELFKGYPNYCYQNNHLEIVYIYPDNYKNRDKKRDIQEGDEEWEM